MFRYFKEHDYRITNPYRGIYYIEGKVLFSTQIVVTKELNQTEYIWLGSLSDKLEKKDMLALLKEIERLQGKADKEFAQSVLEVGLEANKQIVKELIGGKNMSEELLEILKPVIVLREQQVRKEDIKATITLLRNFGHSDKEIEYAIIEQYRLSEEEAKIYMN